MSFVSEMKEKVLKGGLVGRQEALRLAEEPLLELQEAADEIRKSMCGNGFDICTIVNGKCGRCSEDCKYCAQSAHYQARCTTIRRVQKAIRCYPQKNWWKGRNIMRDREFCAIPL